MQAHLLKTHEADNVSIVINPQGLPEDFEVAPGLISQTPIPVGHKIALKSIGAEEAIIRYGQVIGYATQDIPAGTWVTGSLVQTPEPPDLQHMALPDEVRSQPEPLPGFTFQGYRNSDGSVGTRNMLGISNSVQCVAAWTEQVVQRVKQELLPKYPHVDDVVGLQHHYGCGIAIDAPGAAIPIRTLQNLAQNPNLGGEIMILGLGCEKLRPERLAGSQAEDTRSILYMQDESLVGYESMMQAAMTQAQVHLERLNQRRRQTCPASELVVGMQCGGSDAFSGITGNPVAGYAADLLVRAGGTVLFSEVSEVRDAVHLLLPRSQNSSVARALIQEMAWYDDYLQSGGADRSANPSPGNKRGGLTNVVEKALGSIAKSGTMPIVDVLGPGEKVRKRGLQFAATPASDFICGTLQAAAGMNMHVFITGRGSPYGLSMVPVLKVSTQTALARRWPDLIDFDAGSVISHSKSIPEMGQALFQQILDMASGEESAAERLKLSNDLVLFNPGPVT